MIFLRCSFLPYSAMALWPVVLVKHHDLQQNAVLVNHERIHHHQQIELLILPFYLLYVLNYLFNLIRFHNHDHAYREIIFEREAYQMEKEEAYLTNRKWCAWRGF